MLLDNYRIYISGIIKLVDSMVIKSETDAEKINSQLLIQGADVAEFDKTTWKYYLNLSGQYHANDTRIYITSSDTQQEIELNLATLKDHPITRAEYGPDGIYYDDLVIENAKMRHFIDGVFNPVDINVAIEAPNFSILHYSSAYVESNEVDLMDRVQLFIDNYVTRWHISDYDEADALYTAAMFDQLYKALVIEIVNLRTSFCNTSQVSQFHLWSKLKGLYGLDIYRDRITLQQSLWLYRNMRHLILHAGSGYLLDDMIEHLVNTSNLEAFKYDYVKVEGNLHKSLLPDGRFVKREYHDTAIDIEDEQSLDTEETTLYECISEAPQNTEDFDYDLATLKNITSDTTVNEFPTGLLKIEPKSNAISDRFNSQQLKLDYWVYLCSLGLFTGSTTYTLGSFGNVTLNPTQALILYMYASTKVSGVRLQTVPTPRVYNVIRERIPTLTELSVNRDNSRVSDNDLQRILDACVVPKAVDSYEEFSTFVETVIRSNLSHEFIWQGEDNHLTRSMLRDAVNGVNLTTQVELIEPGTNYIDWLGSLKLTDVGVSDNEWYDISLTILKTLLDLDPNNTSLPSSQRAIIEILDALTGYTIIVTAGESRLGYTDIDWFFSRTGDLETIDTGLYNGYLSELKSEWDSSSVSNHVIREDLPLPELELIDTEASLMRADAATGLYIESFIQDFHDQIVDASGFSIEVIE